ncbi:MAG: ATP-binding protein [Candidatus Omnitrophota bacterium]
MTEKETQKQGKATSTVDLESQKNLLVTSFQVRIFSIIVGLLCTNAIRNFLNVDLPWQVSAVFYTWLLASIVYLIIFKLNLCKTKRILGNVHLSYYFFGVAFSTTLVHYLGGAEWIAFSIYFFDLVYSNVLMRRLRGAFVTLLIITCYFSIITLEYKGILPHRRLFPLEEGSYDNFRYILTTSVIIVGGMYALMSFATGLFAKMKEDRERNIIDSRNRYEAKSRQLEDITTQLRKNVAENKYLKRAAMGYVEKKEFEIQNTKRDLEDQIGKLRKTQKSMFFMIEDLNEMSTQLKDARDNLEDKVRERTDELLDISRKLHRSERLAFLGKLSGSVTHELRNPLAVLKNAAYYLEKKFVTAKDDKVAKYIDIIKKEISMIDSIIDDIMGFAKTRSPNLEKCDLNRIVDNAISAINVPDLVEIKKDYEDVPKVEVDSDQTMHALMNLANNAIVAMSGNGVLGFRVFAEDNTVCIEVKDTGPGIPPEQRDLIFEPLYSSKPKGTGLGLPIAKMMIENQEGRIEFHSELGEGTVFRIYFPIERKTRRQ